MQLQLLSTCLGMEKINFSGGEPFIHDKGRYLGELVRYCKRDLCLLSVSIVSNGSLITEEWFEENGKYILSTSSSVLLLQSTCTYLVLTDYLVSMNNNLFQVMLIII